MLASAIPWRKVGVYLGVVIAIATASQFLAYAAAISYASFLKLDTVDPRQIADKAFNTVGALGLLGMILLLIVQAI